VKKKIKKIKKEDKKIEQIKIDKKFLLTGLVALIFAFLFLFFTDSEGKNFFSFLSPLFFIFSFVIISLSFKEEAK